MSIETPELTVCKISESAQGASAITDVETNVHNASIAKGHAVAKPAS